MFFNIHVINIAQSEPQLSETQQDQCPDNKYKTKPGQCGCDIGDIDGDRLEDCVDRHYELLRYNWYKTFYYYFYFKKNNNNQ